MLQPTVTNEMVDFLTKEAIHALETLDPDDRVFGVFDTTSGIKDRFAERYGNDVGIYAEVTVRQTAEEHVISTSVRGTEGRLFFLKRDCRRVPSINKLREHHGIPKPIER